MCPCICTHDLVQDSPRFAMLHAWLHLGRAIVVKFHRANPSPSGNPFTLGTHAHLAWHQQQPEPSPAQTELHGGEPPTSPSAITALQLQLLAPAAASSRQSSWRRCLAPAWRSHLGAAAARWHSRMNPPAITARRPPTLALQSRSAQRRRCIGPAPPAPERTPPRPPPLRRQCSSQQPAACQLTLSAPSAPGSTPQALVWH